MWTKYKVVARKTTEAHMKFSATSVGVGRAEGATTRKLSSSARYVAAQATKLLKKWAETATVIFPDR
jgi:hypothetical protein